MLFVDGRVDLVFYMESLQFNCRRVLDAQKQQCFYCNKHMVVRKRSIGEKVRKMDATKDHLIPQARGFRHLQGNMVWACMKCNKNRGARPLTFKEIARVILLYKKVGFPCVFNYQGDLDLLHSMIKGPL